MYVRTREWLGVGLDVGIGVWFCVEAGLGPVVSIGIDSGIGVGVGIGVGFGVG